MSAPPRMAYDDPTAAPPGRPADETDQDRADDDGMSAADALRPRSARGYPSPTADAHRLLDELVRMTGAGGVRDAEGLRRFGVTAAALRALPGASAVLRVRVANAVGWAALLFSSWRHQKYARADAAGPWRVRQFIQRELGLARASLGV